MCILNCKLFLKCDTHHGAKNYCGTDAVIKSVGDPDYNQKNKEKCKKYLAKLSAMGKEKRRNLQKILG